VNQRGQGDSSVQEIEEAAKYHAGGIIKVSSRERWAVGGQTYIIKRGFFGGGKARLRSGKQVLYEHGPGRSIKTGNLRDLN